MSALITNRILQSQFELIRDRIGAILALEFAHQATFGDSDISGLIVWVSRTIAFDKTDMPAINVNFVHADFYSKDAKADTNTYKFSIDCHAAGKSNLGGDRGDAKAMMRMQKVMGIASRILSDTQYRTLGFDPPSISSRYFDTADIADVMRNDADSLMFGRLVFVVRVNEEIDLLPARTLKGYDTLVKMDLTNEGYFYKVNEYA